AVKAGLPGADFLTAPFCVNDSASAGDEPKAKFPQHSAFLPFELVIRRMARARIRLMRTNVFPAGMSHIQRLLKKPVVEGKRVCMAIGMSHSNLFYKRSGYHSTGFYGG